MTTTTMVMMMMIRRRRRPTPVAKMTRVLKVRGNTRCRVVGIWQQVAILEAAKESNGND
jgi:hypothetical protein